MGGEVMLAISSEVIGQINAHVEELIPKRGLVF